MFSKATVAHHHLRLQPIGAQDSGSDQGEVALPLAFMTRVFRVDCGDAALPAGVPTTFVFRVHGHDGQGFTLWAPDERSMSLYLRAIVDASGLHLDVVPLRMAYTAAPGGQPASSGTSSSSEDDDDDVPQGEDRSVGHSGGGGTGRGDGTVVAMVTVCSTCGVAMPRDSRFCGRCGSAQAPEQAVQVPAHMVAQGAPPHGGAPGAAGEVHNAPLGGRRLTMSRSDTDLQALAEEASRAAQQEHTKKHTKKTKRKKCVCGCRCQRGVALR